MIIIMDLWWIYDYDYGFMIDLWWIYDYYYGFIGRAGNELQCFHGCSPAALDKVCAVLRIIWIIWI